MEWTEIILAFIAIFSGVVTHLLDKKKFGAEVSKLTSETEEQRIKNMGDSLEFYEKLSHSTNSRLEQLITDNNKLTSELQKVKQIVLKLSEVLCTNLSCAHRERDSNMLACLKFEEHNEKDKSKKAKEKA